MNEWPTQPANDFRGRRLPEPAVPAGYAALMGRYDLQLPLPPRLAATAGRHHPASSDTWRLLTPRHRPADTLADQLVFALKWEGVDLGVLAALFKRTEPREIAALVRATPTGGFARRLWFLYEWLTDTTLDLPSPGGRLRYVPVIDARAQVALRVGTPSVRHRVYDNLPGTRAFCPMVRWTPELRAAVAKGLDARAREIIGRTHADLIARAAAFLLLSDSKSSFAIEGERPSSARTARWADAIGQAGRIPLSVAELERLQGIVIGDARFVGLGLRTVGGFVGTHDRQTREPVPEHISARPEDLRGLIEGIIDYSERSLDGGVDPVVAAGVMAFGLVYVHPFSDGNGRIHRWLVHHVLAKAGYNPPGVVFPVSAAILRRLDEYRSVLRSYTAPLLPFIDWRPSADGNIEVVNDTADFYRYFDATTQAEFLYGCVEQTVEVDLPGEVKFLQAFDRFATAVKEIVEMPDAQIELLRGLLEQGDGVLSKRARARAFSALTDPEAARIEECYARSFAD